MPGIFIDANILLGFWGVQDRRLSTELLAPLIELTPKLLITRQVADEVCRNKLSVFLESSKTLKVNDPHDIPAHLDDDIATKALNEQVSSLKQLVVKVNKQSIDVRAAIAEKISQNSDQPWQRLHALFASAQAATPEQMQAARDRRECGNPPGKRGDPLGDQISWQQFLDGMAGEERVWIISRDSDFATKTDKKLLLNPFLREELTARGAKTIEIYDTLAGGIKAIKEAGIITAESLDAARLTELEQEEEEASYPTPPYLIWPDRSWKCPSCHQVNESNGLSAHPSQYGGWSYWMRCSFCGYRFDTGEAYDD